MSFKKRLLSVILAGCIIISASACELIQKREPDPVLPEITSETPSQPDTNTDTESTESDTDTSPRSAKVDFTGTDGKKDISLEIGEDKTVTVKTDTGEAPVWSSSDKSVATVDEKGHIKAVGAGMCVLTAKIPSNSELDLKFTLTVREKKAEVSSKAESSKPVSSSKPSDVSSQQASSAPERSLAEEVQTDIPAPISHEPEKVSGIDLSLSTTVMTVGQTLTPFVTLTPNYVDNTAVTLTVSDEDVLQINQDGTITALGEGACTLTAVPESNKELKSSLIVSVTEPVIEEEPDPDDRPTVNNDELPRSECYVDGILIVNKTYSLPQSYNPGGLTWETQQAFNELVAGAAEDGIHIWCASGFRSYEYQASLYAGYVSWYGQATADTFSARAGHSEHQTGMAIDCNIINDSFTGTPEAIWLENHCHEYGFIIRYPYGKQAVTGYKYEPWHIRYIGDMATEIYESGLTLEEYYGLTSVYGG